MSRERLDILVVSRGLAESREKAQRLIRAGAVRVAGAVRTKPGEGVKSDVEIAVDPPQRFVSRGGEKLKEAFQRFSLRVEGRVCADLGASTGGFTDCLLQHGAARVYAVDVGRGQLHWKLRQDPRVIVMDDRNARHLRRADFPEPVRFVAIDVSFISLTKILPAAKDILEPGGEAVTLIKPQFEAGRTEVGRGGVVRDEAVRAAVVERVRAFGSAEVGLEWLGVCPSPIRGPAGNVEFLAHWRRP